MGGRYEAARHHTGSVRVTLVICLLLAAIAGAILYGLRFMEGAEIVAQERRDAVANRPRVVDTKSPVYDVALRLSKRMELIQCDGEPSVRIASHKAYRILYQRTTESRRGYGPEMQVLTEREHWDIILLPKVTGEAPRVEQISWEELEQREAVTAVYMGEDEKYYWYGNMPLLALDGIRQALNLQGGEDRATLFQQYLDDCVTSEQRKAALNTLAGHLREEAFPILAREIERDLVEDKYGQLGTAVGALRNAPGQECTEFLLRLFDDDRTRRFARHALSAPIREGAKSVYLANLQDSHPENTYFRSTVEAVLQYHWPEAIPLLQQIMATPYVPSHYTLAAEAVRALEGHPISPQLESAEKEILHACSAIADVPADVVENAINRIQSDEDREGALLVAVSITMVYGKMNLRKSREIGVGLLCGFPPDIVDPVLQHLADNVRDEAARKRVSDAYAAVRACRVESLTG